MASNIKFKRSAVQNRVPTTAQLELGELALNTYDGKLYTEKNSGSASVVEIGSILSSLVVDGDNGGGNGDVTFHGTTAGRDLTWDFSDNSLKFADNAKAKFGAGGDLSIYHDGNNNYIDGNSVAEDHIYIRANVGSDLSSNIHLQAKSGEESIVCRDDEQVELYYNGNLRLTTTVDGADISGTGSLKLPVGTTAQRSGSPTAGDMRYNSTTGSFEGYSTNWGELGGGGVGIGSTSVNPGSGVVGHRVGVGFTDINFVGAGLSITGYGTTIVVDLGDAITRKYGRKIHAYTATANQTTFAGLSYTNGAAQISVYLNGAKLSAATYTATSGSTVVLGTGASVGDEIEIICIDSGVDITRNVTSYTATANQTTFTGLGYSDGGDLDVYLNGIRLAQSDYTANNGTSLVLAAGASVGDLLEVVDMGQGAQWNSGFGADQDDIYRLSGGVGIGTTNPTDALNITGNVNIVGVITASSFSGIDSDKISEGNTEVETVDTGSDGHVKVTTEGTERLRIDKDGVFTVTTATVNAYHKLINPNNGYNNALYFESASSTLRGLIGIAGGSGSFSHTSTANDLVIRSNNHLVFGAGGNQGRARIDSSGRMQIGTVTEGNATADDLTIATSGATGMTIRSGSSSEGNIFFSDGTSGDAEYRGMLRYEHNNDAMVIKTAAEERLRIDSSGNVQLLSTDAGSSAGPELKLYRNSASPADADYLGQIKFAGESDTGVERNYAKITGKILDASNGTEDGIIEFAHIKAGSQVITGRWRSDSLQLLNSTNFSVAGNVDITGTSTFGNNTYQGSGVYSYYGSGTSNGSIGYNGSNLQIQNNTDIILRYGSNTKFQTTSTGATVTGKLIVTGDLQVDGTNTVVNSTTMTVDDKNIVLASGSANDAASDGGGITLESGNGNKTWNWVDSTNAWTSSEHINVAAGKVFGFADDTDTSIDRPAANTIRFTTGNDERLRITSDGTLYSYSPDDATPNIAIRSNDTNWHGYLTQTVEGGTISSILSCGGKWNVDGTTYAATKDYNGSFPTSALVLHNQYNGTVGSHLVFLTKANGSSTTDGTVTERFRIDKDGRMSMGTDTGSIGDATYYDDIVINNISGGSGAAGGAGIQILSHSGSWGGLIFGDATSNCQKAYIKYDHGTDDMCFGTNGGSGNAGINMRLTSEGSLNIGGDYEQSTYKLKVTGSFAATTKSFVIDHPTKENHSLRYACLEGPENSVYVRGRTKDGTIDLPDYWTGLVDEDSITVNLTPIGNKRVWVESINNNSVNIASDDDIDCFYTVFAERKDVEKLVVEEEK